MSINFHPEYPGERFLVFCENRRTGELYLYMSSNNRDEATDNANRMDERVNTYFYDLARDSYDGFGYQPPLLADDGDLDKAFAGFTLRMEGFIDGRVAAAKKRMQLTV